MRVARPGGGPIPIPAQIQPQTPAQFEADLVRTADGPLPAQAEPTFDPGSERLLSTLRADLEPLARQHLFTLHQAGVDARIVQGSRTMQQQAALYAQGRTTPGQSSRTRAPEQVRTILVPPTTLGFSKEEECSRALPYTPP
jgi:hypothetical protein